MGLKPPGGLIATALVITAAAAPSAQAFVEMPSGNGQAAITAAVHANAASLNPSGYPPSTSPSVGPNPDEQFLGTKPAVAPPDKATTGRPGLRDSSTSFQYDDAAIGAGVMAGLVLLGAAGTVVVRRRVQPRTS